MRNKITNFYTNIKLKSFLLNVLLFMSLGINIIADNQYKMTIEDIEILDNQSIQASVYIENVGDEFLITSYQCALSINQSIDLSSLQFSYIDKSSELLNEPNLYIGIDNIDGPTELTFVSYIGNDIIRSKTLVGKFILQGNIELDKIQLLNVQWDFDGTISTIITGKDFENITNPLSHISIFSTIDEEIVNILEQLTIKSVTASSTSDSSTSPYGTIDGKYSSDGDNSARWATQAIPSSLIYDLGNKKVVSKTKISFYYFDQGRTYFYNIRVSDDMENWVEVLSNLSSNESEWSIETFNPVEAQFVELEIIGSTNNPGNWSNVWEVEIYGNNSSTGVEDKKELVEEAAIPSDYGISQNYPNPFNPTTKVEVMMKESGSAKLDVYNLLGEKVLAVVDSELSAGVHEINIDGSSLASGIYIYKFDIEGRFSQIKKMNLIK